MRIVCAFVLVVSSSSLAGAQEVGITDDREMSQREVIPAVTEDDAGFAVQSYRGGPDHAEVASKCRSLRREWSKHWLSGRLTTRWTTPCEIVVHADRQSYLASVGRAGGATLGSSLVRRNSDGTVTRRIDLLPAAGGELTALAHELVHVILADHFPDGPPPLWLDEGLAMLLDTPQKQARHWRDCHEAIEIGEALPLPQLLLLDRPPAPRQFPAVYGQSLALTRFLMEKGAPETLLAFVHHAQEKGYVNALETHYGIRGWENLERRWRAFVVSRSKPL